MVKNKLAKQKSFMTGITTGITVGMVLLLAGALLITSLIFWEVMKTETLGYAVMLLMLIATFVGCFVSASIINSNVLLASVCVGGMLLLIMLALTAMVFDGQFTGVPATLALVIGGSLSAALIYAKIRIRPKAYGKKR